MGVRLQTPPYLLLLESQDGVRTRREGAGRESVADILLLFAQFGIDGIGYFCGLDGLRGPESSIKVPFLCNNTRSSASLKCKARRCAGPCLSIEPACGGLSGGYSSKCLARAVSAPANTVIFTAMEVVVIPRLSIACAEMLYWPAGTLRHAIL